MTGQKQTIVGQFFEEVAHGIVGGDLSRNDDGDICLWKEETTIEVKSSGHESSYGFRLDVEQIRGYEQRVSFPFNRAWYLLFAYQNGRSIKDGKRMSDLAKHVTPLTINRYLAETVMWCSIIDLSIVRRWREIKPISKKSVLGHLGTKTVDLKCPEIHSLTNGGFAERLTELDLDPGRFRTLSGFVAVKVRPDLYNEYSLKFPLNVIVPKEEARWTMSMFDRRGFSLKIVH